MYNLRCDEIFKKNQPSIKAVFETFHTGAKQFMTVDDCENMVKKTGIKLDRGESKMIILYCESLQTRIDTLSNLEVMQKMIYIEFVCFLARLAHEVYAGTKQEDWGLHLKVDSILTPIFEEYGEQKIFSFAGEEGEDEEDSDEDGDKMGSGDDDDMDN